MPPLKLPRSGEWARVAAGPPDGLVGELVLVVPMAGSRREEDDVFAATEDGELVTLKAHQLQRAPR